MSRNQNHGIEFEKWYKKLIGLSPTVSGNCWDVCDVENMIQIKATKEDVICLADARSFWKIDQNYKLVVGILKQENDNKILDHIIEFNISKEDHKNLLGSISHDDVENFHNIIKNYSNGKHKEAQTFAKNHGKLLKNKSIISLNPKIDSKKQRRLQCSVSIEKLKNKLDYKIYKPGDSFKNEIIGNFIIKSSNREFK